MNKRRVLIVDDEEAFTRLVAKNLELTGLYEVKTENKGMRALAAADEFKPEIIFLDIVMPDKDGSDIFQEMMNKASLNDVPVIFLSALIPPDDITTPGGLKAAHCYLSKPIDIQQIIEVIEKELND